MSLFAMTRAVVLVPIILVLVGCDGDGSESGQKVVSGSMPWRLREVDGSVVVIGFVLPNSYPNADGNRPWDSELEGIDVHETSADVTIRVRVKVRYPAPGDSQELAVTQVPHEVTLKHPLGRRKLLHAAVNASFAKRFGFPGGL